MDKNSAYGPIQGLLDDPCISEIMINGPSKVFVEKNGIKHLTDVYFSSEGEILKLVEKIYAVRGKRIDKDIPYADVCMDDGTRINATIPPVSRFGVSVTFRKFSQEIRTADDLLRVGTLNKKALDFLSSCVKSKINIIFSGGTGVGKTTALQIFSRYFSPEERVITIEDSAELRLEQQNVISLETRHPDRDGKGAVSLRDLLSNALRMAPDRLIVGEVRGVEAIDMIQAMATGHAGTIGVVHGNSSRDAIARLETMVLLSGANLPFHEIRKLIASTIQVVVHMERMQDGSRKIVSITEIRGLEGREKPEIAFNELFTYGFIKKDTDGKDTYGLVPAIRYFPLFFSKLEKSNISLPKDIFSNT